jgi:hypothetical protein
VAVVGLVVGIAWHLVARGPSLRAGDLAIPGERVPYVVEVLNGTTADGLARAVTRQLRHHGIDVVSFGSAPGGSVDSTQLLVRRGDSTAALVVRRALGLGRITVALDSTLLLDVTVLLGTDAIAIDRNP